MNILLTGATGFLGGRLAATLPSKSDVNLTAAVRSRVAIPAAHVVEVSGLDGNTDWSLALANQEIVIHAAARTHIMKDEVDDPLSEYRLVNVDGTLNLARQASAFRVKRFIFISSIKVNGEQTPKDQAFKADDIPAPEDAYGISKWEAELGLQKIATETGMEVVIIRPPLVYGPGVKGNFASINNLIAMGLLLPLGSIQNQRSFVGVDNLIDLIITCIYHPAAANQVFLASDGQDLSTTELLRFIATSAGKPSRLIPVPGYFLMLAATVLGKKKMAQRLMGSLQVDISKARDLLGWEPAISVEEGLRRCLVKN